MLAANLLHGGRDLFDGCSLFRGSLGQGFGRCRTALHSPRRHCRLPTGTSATTAVNLSFISLRAAAKMPISSFLIDIYGLCKVAFRHFVLRTRRPCITGPIMDLDRIYPNSKASTVPMIKQIIVIVDDCADCS